MTFQQFAKTLRPYYGENRSQDEFVVLLFDNILDIYNENAKGNSPAHIKFRSYNPLKNYDKFQSDTISRYYIRKQNFSRHIQPDAEISEHRQFCFFYGKTF